MAHGMGDILDRLNRIEGVKGSMVVGRDGIVVASDFADFINEDAVAAVSSAILSSLDGALKRLEMGGFKRFVITGSDAKIVLMKGRNTLVLVLLRKDINLGFVGVEIREAVAEIDERTHL
ncbi:MAG: roadblock/LC7 domain-containing protein [Planctomycetes bacterium]|nr:roadblock/LC7 domain-containing protein [Planctomycetota bacterium]